jgi:hypothetical protein
VGFVFSSLFYPPPSIVADALDVDIPHLVLHFLVGWLGGGIAPFPLFLLLSVFFLVTPSLTFYFA